MVCNDNYIVIIIIMNVIDIGEFSESDWWINDKEECELMFFGEIVMYINLFVGNCFFMFEERDNDILYVFKICVLLIGSNLI